MTGTLTSRRADASTLSGAALDARSRALRLRMVEAMRAGNRGHLASAFSVTEILRVLYDDVLRYDAGRPGWPDRDRLILSKGHGCLALYVLLAEKGFFPAAELDRFCARDGLLGGHPEYGRIPGVEASTGSLGHGLSIGIGFALNARRERRATRVFVVVSDGETNEGSLWEALLCAHKHRLDTLVAVVDYNKQQSYGGTAEVLDLEPFAAKWQAFGFAVTEVDGHDTGALRAALTGTPLIPGRPTAVICHTVKGRGVPFMEHNPHWHHKSKLTDDEWRGLRQALEAA